MKESVESASRGEVSIIHVVDVVVVELLSSLARGFHYFCMVFPFQVFALHFRPDSGRCSENVSNQPQETLEALNSTRPGSDRRDN